ncbi:hypothetical protein PISL3812_08283 [Talaromyces islandicus]|uniref:Protein ECM13 n=1 Tax=Talaromyces islandicus TaxID=28573 RepID=A0A0U1M6K9_TALIS|nr:hypothetical protein PISL3812_08283 [Talaromyces islandicus]
MALSSSSSSSPLARTLLTRNKMSITQTYYLAHSARSKLSREAARADHDLRLLVGHANLLDSLMLDLANAEKEQERWFNSTVRNASKPVKPAAQHIRWADTVEEESIEEYDDDSDLSSDSDSDYDEEELQMAVAAATSPALMEDEVEDDDEDDEEAARLTLTRTPSRHNSPPELLDDESSDSEEDSMPPSPTNIPIDTFVSAQDHPAKRTADHDHLAVFDHSYIEQHQGTMIPAY